MKERQRSTSMRTALMVEKLIASACIMIYAAAVPALELNATHVFDPLWPAHARLHEVWQLSTNSALGLWALWLVWRQGEIRLPSLLALFVTGGFLFAYAARPMYDGSMLHSDGSEKLIFGANIGLIAFGLVAAVSALQLVFTGEYRPARTATGDAHAALRG